MVHHIRWLATPPRALIPRGTALSDDVFASRHSLLVRILGVHALLVAVVGGAVEWWGHGLAEALPIAVLALVGRRARGRRGRWAVSLGLLGSSAALVHLSGGLIETHFHFFAVVSLVALYRNWPTLLTTAGFVALHHGVLGTIAPEEVYNHPTAIAHPWLWGGIHALLILFAVVVCAMWWRYSELAETHAAALALQQERGALDAERTAVLQARLEQERQTIERLEELDDLRSAFLQAVSHELRTPLTSIVGFAATLERPDARLDDAQRAHLTGRLRVNAERLSRLLTDLLDVDRLTAGQEVLNRTDADLGAAVVRVVGQVEAPGHTVAVRLDDGPSISADVAKFERIVDNLVRNAVRHTPAGTHIRVRLERTDDGVLLSVSDDGPGIPADLRRRIFDPFEQGPVARHASSPGTGIGLALVAKFAELHGGRAWTDDTTAGGACFRVHLPDPAAGSARPPQAVPGEPLRLDPTDEATPGVMSPALALTG